MSTDCQYFSDIFCVLSKKKRQLLPNFHDDRLIIVAEVFAEEVYPALMFGVGLYADGELYGNVVENVQIVEGDTSRNEFSVEIYAEIVDDYLFQKPVLSAGQGPVIGGISSSSAAEIAGGGEGQYFDIVYV